MMTGMDQHSNAIVRFAATFKRATRRLLGVRLDRSITGDFTTMAFLVVFTAATMLPLIYIVANAFKPPEELFLFPPRFFPQNPTLENFATFMTIIENSWVPFSRYVFNSVLTTAAGTCGHVLSASMAAYALEKHRFPGRKGFFNIVILSLMFSGQVLFVPINMIMNQLGWMDSYWAIIIPAIGAPIGLFLIKQFMSGVPDSLLEAAKIDGAGELYIYWRIVMPMIKPAWLTATIFCAQSVWNGAGSSYIRAEQLKTIPMGLNRIMEGGIARAGAGSVVSLLMLIVPVCVIIITQASIIDTMTSSGLKE